jgi:hypothetical protein
MPAGIVLCSVLTVHLGKHLFVCLGDRSSDSNLESPPVQGELFPVGNSPLPKDGSTDMAQDHLAQGADDEKPVESPGSPLS